MNKSVNDIYTRAPLDKYSFKQRMTIYLADLAFSAVMTLICSTMRVDMFDEDPFEAAARAGKTPIIAYWHDQLFVGTYFLRGRGLVGLASKSFDGEYIARIGQRFGHGIVRGSSSRGGRAALVQMVNLLRQGIPVSLTVDGPRGPRHIAKPGAISLAQKTGNPIIPMTGRLSRYFSLGSWDRMKIPYPFSYGKALCGDPIYVDADGDEEHFQAKLAELQAALEKLSAD